MSYLSALEQETLPADVERDATSGSSRRNGEHASLDISIESVARDAQAVSLAGALISSASRGSDIRFERVAAMREAIRAGRYGVSASDVAQSVMCGLRHI